MCVRKATQQHKKRVLPEWMLAANLKGHPINKNKPKQELGTLRFVHVFGSGVIRKVLANAVLVIDFLTMPRIQRAEWYHEDVASNFHFFLNFGLTAIMSISDMVEVIHEIMPENTHNIAYEGFHDELKMLADFEVYFDLYKIKIRPVMNVIGF